MAARSVRIIFKNLTTDSLTRKSMGLSHGIWSDNDSDSPPETITPKNSVMWESESDGFATGTEGFVSYKSDSWNGHLLTIKWDNPFVGSNEFSVDPPPGYDSNHTPISSNNATVTVLFYPHVG